MKRIGYFLCAVLLLLSIAACGQTQDVAYREGQVELKNANYAKAYAHFKESTDPRAAEELERLVFVPSKQSATSTFKSGQNVQTYIYDARGNLFREEAVFEGTKTQTEYTYNEQNRLLSVKDANSTAAYTYDEQGKRLTYERVLDQGGVYREEYEYDEQGNLAKTICTMTDGMKLIRYPEEEQAPVESVGGECVYDDAGRLLSETYKNGEQFAYTYDEYGNKITERYSWNDTVIEWRYEWELRYYPDGMSEPVKELRDRTAQRRPVA